MEMAVDFSLYRGCFDNNRFTDSDSPTENH